MRLPGLGPKTARRIWLELGVSTLADLRAAAEQERLRTLTGLGPKVEENVLKALPKEQASGAPARPAARAKGCRRCWPSSRRCAPAPRLRAGLGGGEVHRRRETFRDLDVIATATDAEALIDAFTSFDWVVEIVAKGGTKATVVSQEGLRFDLRVVPPECYGNLLQHFTGSKDHNVAMREDAVRRGLSISEYGITEVESGKVHTFTDEEALYKPASHQHPPESARTPATSMPRKVSCRCSSRRTTSAATCTRTRRGRRTARARWRRWRSPRRRAATRTSRSPTTRTTCARAGSRRRRRSWRR